MSKKKADTAKPATVETYRIACELDSPLGYMVLRPVDGRTLDQALLEGERALGLAKGDRVVLTLTRVGDTAAG